ncbi:MAG: cytochrome P450 [Actinomycetota bacterium]
MNTKPDWYDPPPYDQWDDAQPHDMWARARAECPVVETPGNDWAPSPTFSTHTFADADRVMRDSATFTATINGESMAPFMGELMLGMDGDEHRRYRGIVAQAFKRSSIERWKPELIDGVLTRLLDDLAPRGRGDLVASLTTKFPVQVICGIVGVPLEDHEQFNAWADQINHGPLRPEEGMAASAAMVEYLTPLVEARRSEPTGDLLSELVHAEVDGESLTDGKLYGFLRLLLPAGAETTFRIFGSCLVGLLTNPDILARVRDDRSLIGPLVEETLRWDSSVPMISRRATIDTEINGCPVPAGSPVTVYAGSANHDEDRWSDPTSWDIDRDPTAHLAFGTGAHQCLGMHLARVELDAGLNAALDRLPGLRLDPDQPPPTIAGFAFRGPDAIHALWDT